jgi:hypothetical protein
MFSAYFYPTEPGWIETMRDSWKASVSTNVSFSFLDYHPRTLPQHEPFWMYLYYTQTATKNADLQRKVQVRVRVLEHNTDEYSHLPNVYVYSFDVNAQIWFKCDKLEEVCRVDGTVLTDQDFTHAEGKDLLASIRNSIAPVKRNVPIKVIQRTLCEVQD